MRAAVTEAALRAQTVRSHPENRAEVESVRRMARRSLSGGDRASAFTARLLASAPVQRRYRRTAVRQAAMSAAFAGAGRSDRVAMCDLLESCVLALSAD